MTRGGRAAATRQHRQEAMSIFGQTDRLLNFISSAMGADDLLPERLIGSEGINVNFHFELDLLATPSTTIDPKSIVGSKCCVTIQASAKGDLRYINGYIMGFEMYGGDEEFNRYRAHIVPN